LQDRNPDPVPVPARYVITFPAFLRITGACNINERKMNQVYIQYHKTRIGELILGSFEGNLCLLDFRYRKMRHAIDSRLKSGLNAEFILRDDEILGETRKQLDEYLCGNRTFLNIPVLMVGTDFQKSVWNALLKVPYGKTASYLDLAKAIDNEKSVRAVAGANGANAIAIIIPCHRIIGSNGELVGYGGGLAVKKQLLNLEQGYLNLFDSSF